MTHPNEVGPTPPNVFSHMLRLLRHAAKCPLVGDIVAVDLKPEEITSCSECAEIKEILTLAGYPRG